MIKRGSRWSQHLFFLVSVPFLFGSLLTLALQGQLLPNPILIWQVTVDLGTIVFSICLALSILGWFASLLSWYSSRCSSRALALRLAAEHEEHHKFIRRLDHEMKNPLAVLQVSLSSLAQAASHGQEECLTLQLAQSQVARLTRLIRSLRKLADLDSYAPDQAPIDLTELLMEAISAAQSESGREGRSVKMIAPKIPWPPPDLKGDRDLLMLAFFNLIDNALKFTASRDAVEIRIWEDSTAVTIDIADTGPGIVETEIPFVFEELYRGKNSRGIEGSGLGLPLAKKIIELHGGHITARSRTGQGSVFSTRLPLS